MRIWLVFVAFCQLMFAYQYNSFVLKTQEDLYPKILLFDKELPLKVQDGVVDFFVLYEGVDGRVAKKIATKLNEKYKKLGSFRFKAQAVNVWSFLSDKYRKSDALYVLKVSPQKCKRVAKKALKRKIVTFVYDLEDLRCGFLVGSDIEREIEIFLNKKTLLEGKYDFVEEFYLMVRFVE